jgi:hypothetical protein
MELKGTMIAASRFSSNKRKSCRQKLQLFFRWLHVALSHFVVTL